MSSQESTSTERLHGVSVPYAQGLGTLGYRWNADKYVDLVGTYYGNNNTYFRPAFVELDGHIGLSVDPECFLISDLQEYYRHLR